MCNEVLQSDALTSSIHLIDSIQNLKMSTHDEPTQKNEPFLTQVSAVLADIHYDFATILKENKDLESDVDLLPLCSRLEDLRYSVGAMAFELDKLATTEDLKSEEVIGMITSIQDPLLSLENYLHENYTCIKDLPILKTMQEPLEKYV